MGAASLAAAARAPDLVLSVRLFPQACPLSCEQHPAQQEEAGIAGKPSLGEWPLIGTAAVAAGGVKCLAQASSKALKQHPGCRLAYLLLSLVKMGGYLWAATRLPAAAALLL